MRLTLEGRVVRLEPLGLEHAGALAEAAREPSETFALTWVPRTAEQARQYIEAALRMEGAGTAVAFAIVLRESGTVIGTTRLGNLERWPPGPGLVAAPGAPPDVAEIGWTWLAPSAQRTAANTEAKLLLLTHAFEVWKVKRVALKTDVRNARSKAAIERLGAKLEGVLRAHMPAFDHPGPRDSAIYSIVATEWPEVKAGLSARLSVGR